MKDINKKYTDEELINMKFNKLTIKNVIHTGGAIYLDCLCDCGQRKNIMKSDVIHNKVKSCGCWAKERASQLNKKYNKWEFSNNTAIGTTNNHNIKFTIDIEDYERCKEINWYDDYDSHIKTYYIRGNLDGKSIALHRYIMNVKDKDMVVDHINHDTTNNCHSNLRVVSSSKNSMNRRIREDNSSGHTGVRWHKVTQKWQADIFANGKNIYLGLFDNKTDAIKIREEAEKLYFGNYSYKNSTQGEIK